MQEVLKLRTKQEIESNQKELKNKFKQLASKPMLKAAATNPFQKK
jgi:hypothetical protein